MNYLYNGVELPALPKTDKPCAFIGNPLGYANFWYLYFSDEAPVAPAFVNIPGEYILYQFGTIGGEGSENFTEWTLVENSIDGTSFTGTSLWTNTDILKGDDTLYLAASDPIPVGTAPALDPLSLFMGWKAGNWVARQRGIKPKEPVAYRYKLGLLTGTTARKTPSAYAHTNTWVAKTWGGIADWSYDIVAGNVWSDGTNIYYSRNGTSEQIHYILDGDTWKEKSWNVTDFGGVNVWSDGINTYYSYDNTHYVLSGDTWEEKTWNGLTNFSGQQIWSDGEHTYHSVYSEHYILNGDTWEKLSWDINVSSNYNGSIGSFWSDGINIYYSSWNTHYVLNGDTWEETTWNVNFWAAGIWTDGTNIYISGGGLSVSQYILKDGTWEEMAWESMPDGFTGCNTWSDGTNVYYSEGSDQYVLT